MEALEIIDRLEALLVDERRAVARLDGHAVQAFADEKLALAQALDACGRASSDLIRPRMSRLVRGLKENGVLLSHARSILSDVLLGVGVTMPRGPSEAPRSRERASARRVSIRG